MYRWKRLEPYVALRWHEDTVAAVDFCPKDSHLLLSGSKDARLALWRY